MSERERVHWVAFFFGSFGLTYGVWGLGVISCHVMMFDDGDDSYM